MNYKIVAGVIIALLAIAIVFFFAVQGTDYEEETPWGSWYQDYKAYYTDGTYTSLAIIHDNKEVDHIDYILKVDVNDEFTSEEVTFNFNQYDLTVETSEGVVSTLEFEGVNIIDPAADKQVLFTKTINLSAMEDYDPGTYTLVFTPSGTIWMDGVETELPGTARLGVDVENTNSDGLDLSLDTDIVYN